MHFLHWLSTDEFIPHGHCFLWRPDLIWLHVVSDALIAVAYYSIPFSLLYLLRRRPDIEFKMMAMLFAVFILACGTTHVLGIVVLWNPIYWMDGGVKAITAVSSVGTALLVWRAMPYALSLPSPVQLQTAVDLLQTEIGQRQQVERELRLLNAELEGRVRARTEELERSNRELRIANDAKQVLLQELHHRVKNNLQVAAGLLAMQAKKEPMLKSHFLDSAARIQAMGHIHDQLHRGTDAAALDLGGYVGTLTEDLARLYGRSDIKLSYEIPASPVLINFDAANPVVLILNELISNAFKHAFPGGRSGTLTIAVKKVDTGPTITVTDDGVGIQDDESRPRSTGMDLIKMLCQQIGATIDIKSGAGTTCEVRIPRSTLVQ